MMSMQQLYAMNGKRCSCQKEHRFCTQIVTGSGAIRQIPHIMKGYQVKKAFVISDIHTYNAAGSRVCNSLKEEGIPFKSYCFPQEALEPDEWSVGSAVMQVSPDCDIIVGIGSGVINDIGKILSALTQKPYIIVGTAPSMDGYASATSSMTQNGLKVSLPSRAADVIVGDTDILCQAPMELLKAGLGDMLAKFVSICEWRISHIITGEYYCEQIAQLIRDAVALCVSQADSLMQRDPEAVTSLFEGLIISGVAMNYAGLSRPASGVEHYISHVLDMRAAAFGTKANLHGIQCAAGTLIAVRLYSKLKSITPNRQKALAYVKEFDYSAWCRQLRDLLGRGAESMIALEQEEKKYDPQSHHARLERILENWNQICRIIDEELPEAQALEALLDRADMPKTLEDLGVEKPLIPTIFCATKDIRYKYIVSHLAWDLGILPELCNTLY